MRSSGVVEVEERRKERGSLNAVVVPANVSPFAQAGLDEALGLAVGLWSIRSREAVLDAECQADLGKQLRSLRRAVVGQQALDPHTEGRVVSNGVLQEGDGRVLAFIDMDLHEADARVIVDGDVSELRSSRFRDECLSQHWFASLSHMRSVIDNWRDDYNHHRPHSTLGYIPPAVYADRCLRLNLETSTTIQNPGL